MSQLSLLETDQPVLFDEELQPAFDTAAAAEAQPDMSEFETGLLALRNRDDLKTAIGMWAEAELRGDTESSTWLQDSIQNKLIEDTEKGQIGNGDISNIIENLHRHKEMVKAEIIGRDALLGGIAAKIAQLKDDRDIDSAVAALAEAPADDDAELIAAVSALGDDDDQELLKAVSDIDNDDDSELIEAVQEPDREDAAEAAKRPRLSLRQRASKTLIAARTWVSDSASSTYQKLMTKKNGERRNGKAVLAVAALGVVAAGAAVYWWNSRGGNARGDSLAALGDTSPDNGGDIPVMSGENNTVYETVDSATTLPSGEATLPPTVEVPAGDIPVGTGEVPPTVAEAAPATIPAEAVTTPVPTPAEADLNALADALDARTADIADTTGQYPWHRSLELYGDMETERLIDAVNDLQAKGIDAVWHGNPMTSNTAWIEVNGRSDTGYVWEHLSRALAEQDMHNYFDSLDNGLPRTS